MKSIKSLELNKILLSCAEFAICDNAKETILNIKPATSYDSARLLLDQTDTASAMSIRFGNPAFYRVVPCTQAVTRADRGAQLSTRELLDIAAVLRSAKGLNSWYKSAKGDTSVLDNLFDLLSGDYSLEKEIGDIIIEENAIADNASTELSSIRRKIRNAEHKTRETLEKITRSVKYQKYLQEQIVTIRNGRYVVPVRAEYKNEIKGMIHDTSSSGSTVFIEPMTVIELNNQVKELEIEQVKEIDRILLYLSAQVAAQGAQLRYYYDTIVALDVIFARCKLGDAMKGAVPEFTPQCGIDLKAARHPLIDKDHVVPIDIKIGDNFDTLVITGPNTGGKTVALKTVGLLTLMTLCGMMIPASSRSTIGFYSNVLSDIGDEQSIEQSLSTFSGHMTNIVAILDIADSSSLVLIDELGAGTDPVEGAALAVAIIAKLRENGAHIVATTHYAEMKIFALQTEGVENASCEFDVTTLRPTYRLLIGTPGRSNAFAIANRLGLSSEIIHSAEALVSTENRRFEEVVDSLERARQALEQEQKQAAQLRQAAATTKKSVDIESKNLQAEQDKIIQEARDRSRSILERVRYQADQVLDELEKLKKQKDKSDFSSAFSTAQKKIKGLMGEMEDVANPVMANSGDGYQLPRPIKQGDTVFLVDFNTQGTVLSPPDGKNNLQVRAGILDTQVALNRVRLLDKPSDKVRLNGGSVGKTKNKTISNDATGKVDLRGLDSEDARLELRRYIDYALLNHLATITIVHGKGTGVLREMVGQELKNSKHVAKYRLGLYGEGGDGVTIAEF